MNNGVIDSLLQEIVELKARVTELENAPQAAVLRFEEPVSGGGGGDDYAKPWTFVPGSGWTNAWVQIGYTVYAGNNAPTITNLSSTADGDYYLKANLMTDALELVVSSGRPADDFVNSIVHTYIGTVQNGEQTRGIYQMPVLYKYVY